jgi:hypothetical protein
MKPSIPEGFLSWPSPLTAPTVVLEDPRGSKVESEVAVVVALGLLEREIPCLLLLVLLDPSAPAVV